MHTMRLAWNLKNQYPAQTQRIARFHLWLSSRPSVPYVGPPCRLAAKARYAYAFGRFDRLLFTGRLSFAAYTRPGSYFPEHAGPAFAGEGASPLQLCGPNTPADRSDGVP